MHWHHLRSVLLLRLQASFRQWQLRNNLPQLEARAAELAVERDAVVVPEEEQVRAAVGGCALVRINWIDHWEDSSVTTLQQSCVSRTWQSLLCCSHIVIVTCYCTDAA